MNIEASLKPSIFGGLHVKAFKHTGVAQLVEHWSPKPGVGSSSLSTRANFYLFYENSKLYQRVLF